MPYIKQIDRLQAKDFPTNSGELNYAITCKINRFLKQKPKSYTSYNEAIGVLECAKMELYRRMIAKYEDKKIIENGDVYE